MPDSTRTPGVEGSTFEWLVSGGERIQTLPDSVFLLLLLGLAGLITRLKSPDLWLVWGIFLGDFALLSALPRFNLSFGPPKPPSLLLAIFRTPFFLLPTPWMWLVQVCGTVLVFYGFYIEPQRLLVTKQEILTNKLRLDSPVRIVHIGDLHFSKMTRRDRKLIPAVLALKPDLICFTGDVLSYSTVENHEARHAAKSILGSLRAPLGVFAVAGSPPVDTREVLEVVYRDSTVKLLDGTHAELCVQDQVIELTGLSCSHDPDLDGQELRTIQPSSRADYRVLLYHSPDLAPRAADCGFDLQLSGHTHGGQVRLPFIGALYTSSLYGKRFEFGRYQVGKMILYVTRGLGMEGKGAPRIRFLCPPEIVMFEIKGETDAARRPANPSEG